jgi:hypothetical protein
VVETSLPSKRLCDMTADWQRRIAQMRSDQDRQRLARIVRILCVIYAILAIAGISLLCLSLGGGAAVIDDGESLGITPLYVVCIITWSMLLPVMAATSICLLIWVYRYAASLQQSGAELMFMPLACVIWFFIPLVDLIIPYFVLRDLWLNAERNRMKSMAWTMHEIMQPSWLFAIWVINICAFILPMILTLLPVDYDSSIWLWIGGSITMMCINAHPVTYWFVVARFESRLRAAHT